MVYSIFLVLLLLLLLFLTTSLPLVNCKSYLSSILWVLGVRVCLADFWGRSLAHAECLSVDLPLLAALLLDVCFSFESHASPVSWLSSSSGYFSLGSFVEECLGCLDSWLGGIWIGDIYLVHGHCCVLLIMGGSLDTGMTFRNPSSCLCCQLTGITHKGTGWARGLLPHGHVLRHLLCEVPMWVVVNECLNSIIIYNYSLHKKS